MQITCHVKKAENACSRRCEHAGSPVCKHNQLRILRSMQTQLLLYKKVRKARLFLLLQIANRTICIQHNSTVHSHLQCSHIQYHCFLPRFCCLFSFRQHSGERLIHCLLLTQSSLLPLRCMCTAQKYNGCSVLARQLDAHVE